MFRLSSHAVGTEDGHPRTFVLLPNDRAPAQGLTWKSLAPRSFDATEVASGRVLGAPVELTLVGPAGTRVVTSTKHVFLSRTWELDDAVGAIEVKVPRMSGERFAIAIEGRQQGAKWIAVERSEPTRSLAAWTKMKGADVTDGEAIYVSRVPGTKFETVSYFSARKGKFVTALKEGAKSHGVWDGSVMGAFTNQGQMKLVLVDGSRATQIYLGAA